MGKCKYSILIVRIIYLYNIFIQIYAISGNKSMGYNLQRVLRSFGNAIAKSTPHIYLSLLPMLPTDSLIVQKYSKFCQSVLHIEKKIINWPAQEFLLSETYNIIYSPNGKYIAYIYDENTIAIANAKTGHIYGKLFQDHTKLVFSIAYSPDGEYIASGYDDGTIII